MHHIPKPQDQARLLEKALKDLNFTVKHQDALQLIARVMGHKDWKTMSAAIASTPEFAPVVVASAIPHTLPAMLGPDDGDIYEGMVTVDMTLSGYVKVRAHSREEAQQLLREAGHAQYPHGFEVDDGNYRGPSDFYLADPNAVENLSEVVFDRDGDFWGNAKWKGERFQYEIDMSRDEPDSSDEDHWAAVSVTLTVSDSTGTKVTEDITDYEVHNDNLAEWIEECIDNGDFDEQLEELAEKLLQKLKKQ
jgi:hypothetical protein